MNELGDFTESYVQKCVSCSKYFGYDLEDVKKNIVGIDKVPNEATVEPVADTKGIGSYTDTYTSHKGCEHEREVVCAKCSCKQEALYNWNYEAHGEKRVVKQK